MELQLFFKLWHVAHIRGVLARDIKTHEATKALTEKHEKDSISHLVNIDANTELKTQLDAQLKDASYQLGPSEIYDI